MYTPDPSLGDDLLNSEPNGAGQCAAVASDQLSQQSNAGVFAFRLFDGEVVPNFGKSNMVKVAVFDVELLAIRDLEVLKLNGCEIISSFGEGLDKLFGNYLFSLL